MCIAHSVLGGDLGVSSPREILKMSASEADRDLNHARYMAIESKSGNLLYGRFSEHLPFRISLCIWDSATELSLGSCRFEYFMFAGHGAVIHIEMCTESE